MATTVMRNYLILCGNKSSFWRKSSFRRIMLVIPLSNEYIYEEKIGENPPIFCHELNGLAVETKRFRLFWILDTKISKKFYIISFIGRFILYIQFIDHSGQDGSTQTSRWTGTCSNLTCSLLSI